MFSQPDSSCHGLVYSEHFGPCAYIERCRSFFQRVTGSVLSPLSTFLLLQGIETLLVRIGRHVANGRAVTEHLHRRPKVRWVNYVGFEDNQYHRLVQKYLDGRACSLITFGVQGSFEGGRRFYNSLGLIQRLANFGDAKSLARHPASTTHGQMPAEVERKAGILPETIHLSVGTEHMDNIIEDLDQALGKA